MNAEYQQYQPLINTAADAHGLDAILLAALVWTESNFKADAFHHEPQVWSRTMKPSAHYGHLSPRRYSSRYGLTQLLWLTAVESGLDPAAPPETLFIPEISLDYGGRHLRACLDWAATFPGTDKERLLSAVAAFREGRNGAQAPPNPRNIAYSLRVWQHMQELAKGLQGA